jgi:hypothetical protein
VVDVVRRMERGELQPSPALLEQVVDPPR